MFFSRHDFSCGTKMSEIFWGGIGTTLGLWFLIEYLEVIWSFCYPEGNTVLPSGFTTNRASFWEKSVMMDCRSSRELHSSPIPIWFASVSTWTYYWFLSSLDRLNMVVFKKIGTSQFSGYGYESYFPLFSCLHVEAKDVWSKRQNCAKILTSVQKGLRNQYDD